MAEWRTFAATNNPGTCKWCGKKLRRKSWVTDGSVVDGKWTKFAEPIREYPYDKPGDYGDGHFCGLRCAYQFAVKIADGRRILVAD